MFLLPISKTPNLQDHFLFSWQNHRYQRWRPAVRGEYYSPWSYPPFSLACSSHVQLCENQDLQLGLLVVRATSEFQWSTRLPLNVVLFLFSGVSEFAQTSSQALSIGGFLLQCNLLLKSPGRVPFISLFRHFFFFTAHQMVWVPLVLEPIYNIYKCKQPS